MTQTPRPINRRALPPGATGGGRIRLAAVSLVGAIALLALTVLPAAAHDPIFVGDDQTTPDNGPYMPDGTISWALYGQVLAPEDTRGFEFDLREGDELYVSLLIPNLSPELDLADEELPVLDLIAPDGTSRTLVAEIREVFDEPFSGTSYVTLLEVREPGQAGRWQGVVVGNAASRFTVAIGETEIFFTETERSGDRPDSFAEITEPLQVWYSTPPGGEATDVADDIGIDEGMIEDAMESGGAVDSREVDEAEPAESADAGGPEDLDDPDDLDGPDDLDDTVAEETVTESAPAESDSSENQSSETQSDEESGTDSAVSDAESAVGDTDAESGGGTGWVAPVVVLGVVAAGGGYALTRRRSSGDGA